MHLSEKDESIEISVVIPARNEEESIGECLEKVKEVFDEERIEGEIIVSDSSEDSTPQIARDKGARVVKPSKKGYGNAYLRGMSEARGKYVFMGDADETYDFSDIPKLFRPLQKGEAEVVIGNRLEGGISDGAMSIPHRIGQPIMTGLLNLFHRTGVSDAHSGFRAFTREALEKMELRAEGMDFASELIIEADRRNLKVKEVPIKFYPRPEGSEATYNYFSDSWDHLKLILLRAPTKAFAIPGFLLIMLGILVFGLGVVESTLPTFESSLLAPLFSLSGYTLVGAVVFARYLDAEKDLADHDWLSSFFRRHFTPGRGFWLGLILFFIGIIPILPLSFSFYPSHKIILFTLLFVGIETGFLSLLLDLADV